MQGTELATLLLCQKNDRSAKQEDTVRETWRHGEMIKFLRVLVSL